MRKLLIPLAVLTLIACQAVHPEAPSMLRGQAAALDGRARAEGSCTATWLQQTDDLGADPGPWAAFLVAYAHGQAEMQLVAVATPPVPVTFEHSTQPEGEFLLLSVESSEPVTVRATATRFDPFQECSTAIVHFPAKN